MKRALSVILLISMLFLMYCSSFSVLAEEISDSAEDAEQFQDALQYSCSYDSKTQKVSVVGTMHYDSFAEHKNSELIVYAVQPGADEYAVANDPETKPLARSEVSIRFEFTFKTSSMADRYCRYAIFLRSPDGTLTLGTEAQYPEVSADIQDKDREEAFKGLYNCNSVKYSSVDAGSAILPIYLDELFTDRSNGYIFQLGHEQIFFNKSYIDGLDAKVRSLSVSGTEVYLQLLLKKGGSFGTVISAGAKYYLPDVYDENIMSLIYSAVEFLSLRYMDEQSGKINGMIVGKAWDEYAKYNSASLTDIDEYAEKSAFYAVLVANSARSVSPTLDIILPFSGENFKSEADFSGIEGRSFSTKMLIERVMEYFDDSFEWGISCSFMLESSETPFGITNENYSSRVNKAFEGYSSEIYAGTQVSFSSFLRELSKKYKSVPQSFSYLWNVPDKLSGNALAAAYAYSYYALFADINVDFFVANFGTDEMLNDIFRVLKYINTDKGYDATKHLLEFFGDTSWQNIIGRTLPNGYASKLIFGTEVLRNIADDCRGSFKYFDFTDTFIIDGWYGGVGCSSIKIDYANSKSRALKADMKPLGGSGAEIIYNYEFYENITHTQYLEFELQVSDTCEESLYEVIFVCENSDARLEASTVVSGNNMSKLALDMAEHGRFEQLESIKIAVRCIYGDMSEYTLWLHDISGHSKVYDSNKLVELIQNERDKIRNVEQSEEEGVTFREATVAICIIAVLGVLGTGLFIAFRRDNRSKNEE